MRRHPARAGRRNIGEDPAKLPQTYAKLLNRSIAKRPKDMAVCMHICRGNNQSAWLAEGGYEPVAEVLFNAVDVDGYFLEYDSPRAGDFKPLRYVPKGKTMVLGLVPRSCRNSRPRTSSSAASRRRRGMCRSISSRFSAMRLREHVIEGNKVTVEDESRS